MNSLYMSAQRDREFNFKHESSIYVHIGDDVSVWEKNLRSVLNQGLRASGFGLSLDVKSADLVLEFHLGERRAIVSSYDSVPETRSTFGYFGGQRFFSTSTAYRTIPYAYTQNEKGLLIRLFRAKEFLEGKRLPVWEGLILGDRDVFNQRQEEWTGILLKQLGEDYEGRITLE